MQAPDRLSFLDLGVDTDIENRIGLLASRGRLGALAALSGVSSGSALVAEMEGLVARSTPSGCLLVTHVGDPDLIDDENGGITISVVLEQ